MQILLAYATVIGFAAWFGTGYYASELSHAEFVTSIRSYDPTFHAGATTHLGARITRRAYCVVGGLGTLIYTKRRLRRATSH
jgi:hypothetical protein